MPSVSSIPAILSRVAGVHSLPIASVAGYPRRNVVSEFVATIAVVARASIAVEVFQEIKLSIVSASAFHEHHHGAGNVGEVRKVVGEIRNV